MRHPMTFQLRVRGVTLTELMVAMGLSVMLLGGVATMFVSSRSTYVSSERLARIEENGRFALDSIQRDLRGAGFVGCNQRAQYHNVLNDATNANNMWNFQAGIRVHNALSSSSWVPTLDTAQVPSPMMNSDVLILHSPVPATPVNSLRAAMTSPTDVVPVKQYPAGHKGVFRDNQIVMVSSCEHSTVFEITKYDPQAGTLEHKVLTPPATSPGNAVDTLEWRYTQFDSVVAIQTVIYYVRDVSGVPTLFRRIDNNTPEALVEHVENMQVQLGYDTDNDRQANDLVDPSAATTSDRIISATVALLVRSPETFNDGATRTYNLLGTTVTTNDNYMRKVFSTTVLIRNTAE
jgi:type IV pilus assembly protein PilW